MAMKKKRKIAHFIGMTKVEVAEGRGEDLSIEFDR